METNTLIVKADKRVEHVTVAGYYYDNAWDALQETVYYMAMLATKNIDMGGLKKSMLAQY